MRVILFTLLKIDVEMHEPEVLQGMVNLLERDKPFVIVEVIDTDVAERVEECFSRDWMFLLLEENKIEIVKKLKVFERYPYYFNYLIVHKDRMDRIEHLMK